ncbi:MAG: hypothetical protein ACLQDL_03425 [Spirochaetia bacterium]
MAKSKKVTVPDMIEAHSETPAAALELLRKHLKSGIGERYESRTNYLAVIMDRNTKNVALIAQLKDTQWRVAYYAILLFAAVTGAVQLVRALVPEDIWWRAIAGAAAAVSLFLVFYASKKMMDKIVDDLALLREHSKLNEEMLNITVGIHILANKVVSSRREALQGRHDFSLSAEENRLIFANGIHAVMTGSFVFALIVCQLLVWTGTRV